MQGCYERTDQGEIHSETAIKKKKSFTCIQQILIPACLAVSHQEQIWTRWLLYILL